jgi:inorganic triphosphatase YgiF
MGHQPREVELKLEISPADLGRLRRHPRIRELGVGRASSRALRSVYFDTPALDLARRGIGLRLRWADGARAPVQTVKARLIDTRSRGAAGLFERAEVECRVGTGEPDLDVLPDAALRRRLRRILAGKRLGPVFETRMRRTRRWLRDGRHEWTLDLDVGEVRTAARREPFCEVELELRRGDPVRLYDFALRLAETIALRPGTESKADRGYALVRAASPRPKRTRRSPPARETRVGEVLARALERCAGELAQSARVFFDGADPDGVRRMRDGALELCALLEVLGEGLPKARARRLREEARWLADALGAPGEIDRFAETFPERVLRAGGRRRDLAPLRRALSELRAERVAVLRDAGTALRFGRLSLELGRLQLSGAAAQPARRARSAFLARRAVSFAPNALARGHREVLRMCAARAAAAARARREALEAQQCACALFGGLYPGAPARRYRAAVVRLARAAEQMDAVAAPENIAVRVVDRITPHASSDTLRAVEIVAARATRGAQRRLAAARRAFRAARPFWRAR